MPAKQATPKPTPSQKKATRTRVKLPESISSTPAEWPGQPRTQNSALHQSLQSDVSDMGLESVRRYDVSGAREQKALENAFRAAVKRVHGDTYGVRVARQPEAVFFMLSRRQNRKSNK